LEQQAFSLGSRGLSLRFKFLQHFLYFLPEPHGHFWFGNTFDFFFFPPCSLLPVLPRLFITRQRIGIVLVGNVLVGCEGCNWRLFGRHTRAENTERKMECRLVATIEWTIKT
jgi:hypothetical protein